jgi:cysteinyl-tRNA synthetase
MPEAISVFNAFVSFSNTHVDSGSLSKGEAESIFEMFKTFDFVLGLLDFSILDTSDIPAEIMEKLNLRNEAKKEKDFQKADALRDELTSL